MDTSIHRIIRTMDMSREQGLERQAFAQGADLRLLREYNRLLILNLVRQFGPLARFTLAQHLRLSRTTVSSIIENLLQEGLVREGSHMNAAPKGGRRAILLHFNADAGYVVGIDVGRSHLTLLLTNLAAEIVAQTSLALDTEQGPDVCLPLLIRETHAFLESSSVEWSKVIGIGLGIPGPLDAMLHTLSSPPHMPGWDQVDIWQSLRQAFPVPLYIDNDANMGALSESRLGAGRGQSELAYVKIGTGIGAGLILHGRIYRGHGGSAGEVGHQTIDENGPLCVCGNRGCLETLASASAIVVDASQGISLLRKRFQEGASSQETFTTILANEKKKDIVEVIQAAYDGDLASIAALERAGERLGLALANLINIFNPSAIILDGGVTRAGDLLLAPARRVAETSSLPAAWRGTQIVLGKLGTTAIALGAALTVIDAAFAIPTVASMPNPTAEAGLFSRKGMARIRSGTGA